MKKIISLLLIPFAFAIAQTEKGNIELPDFVITGKQSVNVQAAKKRKPDFIPTLSKDFFTPQFSPEELPLFVSSDPVDETPDMKLSGVPLSSRLKIQVGNYTFPTGEFNFSQSYQNFLTNAKVWGSNIREYIPNAGYNSSGVSLHNNIFLSTKSDFLPGSEIKINADYQRDSYRFFASALPDQLRETNSGSLAASIASSYNKWIGFELGGSGAIRSFNDTGLKESLFRLNGGLDFKQDYFTIGGKGEFTGQSLSKNLSGTDAYNYFSSNGYVQFSPIKTLIIKAGINFGSGATKTFYSPFGTLEYKMGDGLTASAEFNPHSEFFTFSDFAKKNLYFNLGTVDNVFVEYKIDLNGTLAYQFEKLFSFSLTAGFARLNNSFYFSDLISAGKFDIVIFPESEILSGGINFTLLPSSFGSFIADLHIRNVKDAAGNYVPYEPALDASLAYEYNFPAGIDLKLKYKTAQGIYTDLLNTDKLPGYNDLSVSLGYEILNGLKLTADFQNIFNRANFVWKQYQEKPFDFLLGIEYRW